MKNTLILVYGKSGSGKTTIVNKLCDEYGFTQVQSYTTRKPRYENETGHTFVTVEEFMSLRDEMVGYTYFNNNYYGTTQEQCDNCDFYVVDIDGINYFNDKYKGHKKIMIMHVVANWNVRLLRLIKRDGFFKGVKRFMYDIKAFSKPMKHNVTYTVDNSDNNVNLSVGDLLVNVIVFGGI